MRSHRVRDLSIEEIERVVEVFKQDLQEKANRYTRKDENRDAYAAILAKEYVDELLFNLRLLAGSRLQEYLSRPARARPIHINKALK